MHIFGKAWEILICIFPFHKSTLLNTFSREVLTIPHHGNLMHQISYFYLMIYYQKTVFQIFYMTDSSRTTSSQYYKSFSDQHFYLTCYEQDLLVVTNLSSSSTAQKHVNDNQKMREKGRISNDQGIYTSDIH